MYISGKDNNRRIMIKKIKTTEYLKGYGDMGDGERRDYLKRVGEWLAVDGRRLLEATDRPMARAQNIMLLAARWSKEDCAAFHEGAMLLSALAGTADTWLPTQLYAKSAYRAVRQMVTLLGNPDARPEKAPTPQGGGAAAHYNHEPRRAAGAGAGHPQALPSPDATVHRVTTDAHGAAPVSQSQQTTGTGKPAEAPVPRPRHIDQYVHLLPQKTQERASQVKGLLRDLDDAREKARLLMEAGEHPDKIELWARKATRLDNAVKAVYRELDSEWGKLVKQGRVWVDDLGNAHVKDIDHSPSAVDHSHKTELTSEQKARRRELRKWLTDTRRGNGDTREEHLKKWSESFKEYLTLEPKDKALADRKILDAASHYGIRLPE